MKKAKSLSQCKNCFREIDHLGSKTLCSHCLESKRRWYQKYKTRVGKKSVEDERKKRELYSSYGVCTKCFKRPAREGKKCCLECADKKNKHDREYRAKKDSRETREKRNAKQRISRAKNQEKIREYERNYYKLHPEKYSGATLKRNAVKRKADGSFTNKEWLLLLDKYGRKCLCCGAMEDIHKDHVIPLSRGGSNYISNIQPLCGHCNKKKMTQIIDFRPFGAAILDWT